MLCMLDSSISPQLRKGVVEFYILGLVADSPMYGWELSARLQSDGLIAGIGTLYPLLTRLQARGALSSQFAKSLSGPTRKYYSATEKGAEELAEFARTWIPFSAAIDSMMERFARG